VTACVLRACVVLVAVTAGVVSAQAQQGSGGSATARAVPRTPEGRPDLSGIWMAGEQPLLVGEEEANRLRQAAASRPRPRREPPPYTPEAEARRQEYLARRGIDDPMARCLLSGVPRVTFRPLPFQIVQTRDLVVFLYEVHHAFRIIPTDSRPHPDDIEPSYMGESVGRWEGDTLVVDVIGFNGKTWLAGTGTIHSDKLRVVERYTRDSYDTIHYEATMEDPEVFTKPWRMEETLYLRPGERIREYECIENNEDIQRIEKLLQDESLFRRPTP